MAELGEAVLKLTTDATELHDGLNKAKEDADNFAVSLKDLLAGFLTFEAAKQTLNFFKDCLNVFIQSEDASVHLGAALRATGQEYVDSTPGLVAFSHSMQDVSTYTHAAIEQAAAMLVQVGSLTEEGVKKAIPAVMDFAAAMGIDLNTAALMVSRAMEGNETGMKRYGIQIANVHDPSKEFDVVLQALVEHFGGMALAMSKTTGGQLQQFTNQIKDSKEQLGGFVGYLSGGFIGWLHEWGDALHIIDLNMRAFDNIVMDLLALRNPFDENSRNAVLAHAAALKLITDTFDNAERTVGKFSNTNNAAGAAAAALAKVIEQEKEAVERLTAAYKDNATWGDVINARLKTTHDATLGVNEVTNKTWTDYAKTTKETTDVSAFVARSMIADFGQEKAAALDFSNAFVETTTVMTEADKEARRSVEQTMNAITTATVNAMAAMVDSTVTAALQSENAWKALGTAAINAVGAMLESIAKGLFAQAAGYVASAIAQALGIVTASMSGGSLAAAAEMTAAGIAMEAAGAALESVKLAKGGDFTVPPGYPNDSFPMRVQSGERVSVTPAGESGGPATPLIIQIDSTPIYKGLLRATRNGIALINPRGIIR